MDKIEKGIIYIKENNFMLVKSLLSQGLSEDELQKLYVYACINNSTESMVELSKYVSLDTVRFALYASSEQGIKESVKFNKKLIESFDN